MKGHFTRPTDAYIISKKHLMKLLNTTLYYLLEKSGSVKSSGTGRPSSFAMSKRPKR